MKANGFKNPAKIIVKSNEYIDTGTVGVADRILTIPALVSAINLTKIYGVGSKKAQSLFNDYGIHTLSQLQEEVILHPKILNAKQKIGLKYYEDLQLRIPRDEMIAYTSRRSPNSRPYKPSTGLQWAQWDLRLPVAYSIRLNRYPDTIHSHYHAYHTGPKGLVFLRPLHVHILALSYVSSRRTNNDWIAAMMLCQNSSQSSFLHDMRIPTPLHEVACNGDSL